MPVGARPRTHRRRHHARVFLPPFGGGCLARPAVGVPHAAAVARKKPRPVLEEERGAARRRIVVVVLENVAEDVTVCS